MSRIWKGPSGAPLRGGEERDENRVQDIARLLLVENERNHADALCKFDRVFHGGGISPRMAHDLCGVVAPDLIGKVDGKKPVRASGCGSKLAWQER